MAVASSNQRRILIIQDQSTWNTVSGNGITNCNRGFMITESHERLWKMGLHHVVVVVAVVVIVV